MLLWLLFHSTQIFAGLGPIAQAPPIGLCLIDFSDQTDSHFSEVCSGLLVSEKLVLTAAHCLRNKKPKRLICQGQEPKIASFEIHPEYEKNIPFEDSSYQKRDLARIKLSVEVSGPQVAFGDLNREKADYCFFAGFSEFLGKPKSPPSYQQWEVSPEALEVHQDLIVLRGLKEAGALVEPGDSGGSLFCKMQEEWKLVGIISGRDYKYNSLFSAVDKWSAQDAQFERPLKPTVSALNSLIPKAKELGFPVDPHHYFVANYLFEKELRTWLVGQSDFYHRVKPFSVVEVFEANSWIKKPLYDLLYNYLKIKRVENNWVYGDFRVLGPPQSFPGRLSENQFVRVHINDLEFRLFNLRD